jgi:hypothetical protein
MTLIPRRRLGTTAALAVVAGTVTGALAAPTLLAPAADAQVLPDAGSLQVSVGRAVSGSLAAGIPAAWLDSLGAPLPSPGPGVTVEVGATWGAPRPRIDGPGPFGHGQEPAYPPVFASTRAHAWQSWALVDDDTIRVRFTGALPQCEGAAIRAVESDTAVTVAVRTGPTPQSVAMPCPLMAVYYEATIELRTPLGDRAVLDGAA